MNEQELGSDESRLNIIMWIENENWCNWEWERSFICCCCCWSFVHFPKYDCGIQQKKDTWQMIILSHSFSLLLLISTYIWCFCFRYCALALINEKLIVNVLVNGGVNELLWIRVRIKGETSMKGGGGKNWEFEL